MASGAIFYQQITLPVAPLFDLFWFNGFTFTFRRNSDGTPPGSLATIRMASSHCWKPESPLCKEVGGSTLNRILAS
jgi:hypothetical protein